MYEKLAEYYDMFMDAPYDEWNNYIEKHLTSGASGMDIGCGTGEFTLRLARDGYAVIGADLSTQMLEIANKKAKKQGQKVEFVLQNAESFQVFRPLDFITANCDVVNYLKNPQKFFTRAYRALKTDGVLIFDISSRYKLRNILGNQVYTLTKNGVTYIWENFYDEKNDKVDIKMTFFAPAENNNYSKSEDYQTQYAHTRQSIEDKLARAGFSKVKVYGFLSNDEPSEREERLHFIAYK